MCIYIYVYVCVCLTYVKCHGFPDTFPLVQLGDQLKKLNHEVYRKGLTIQVVSTHIERERRLPLGKCAHRFP